jgi:cell division protein ZapA
MSQVSITINGRDYTIACDDGQEDHLTRLSDYLNRRISEVVAAVGQVGDTRLLVMLVLLIADELSDAYAELAAARGEEGDTDLPVDGRKKSDEESTVTAIEALAEQIETIAGRLEAT